MTCSEWTGGGGWERVEVGGRGGGGGRRGEVDEGEEGKDRDKKVPSTIIVHRVNYRQRNYAEVSTELHGAISVVEEFSKYQSIPQIKQLIDR